MPSRKLGAAGGCRRSKSQRSATPASVNSRFRIVRTSRTDACARLATSLRPAANCTVIVSAIVKSTCWGAPALRLKGPTPPMTSLTGPPTASPSAAAADVPAVGFATVSCRAVVARTKSRASSGARTVLVSR